ncbi:MAG: lysophospholipid acyltransferase family protein [Candidatus Omnitrophica bacterium]|nr:lysophospholipid acyltransferase family protein [Candidatus Omnitrophota bacterium]
MHYLYFLGNLITSTFPRNICYLFARFVSVIHYYISKKDRETVIYNLSPVIAEKNKIKRYAKEVFVNFAYYLVDFFRYSKLNKDFIKKHIELEGLDNLNKALAQGKGVIILAAHLGNYELAGAVLSLLGYPLSVVALSHKNKRVNRFFEGQRQRVGMKVIPTGATIRSCFSALKSGDMLALLGDRNFSGEGIKLDMFSRQAYFPRGIAFFALKTGVPIVPVFLTRKDKKFYHLVCEKPIVYDKEQQDEVAIIRECNLVLEKYIKKYPQQWYMFRKCWVGKESKT